MRPRVFDCKGIQLNFYHRIYLPDLDLSIRCPKKEDASLGHERQFCQIQQRFSCFVKHHSHRGHNRPVSGLVAQFA